MSCFKVILLGIFLISCSSTKKRSVFVAEGEPEWLYAASAGCTTNEICASGEGSSQSEADAHAKKALAGIFETKIKAEFQFSKQSFTDKEVTVMKEFIEDQVNQQVDQVLKGATIKNHFKKNGLIFSLASLDKAKSLKILKQELTKTDDEMNHHFKLKNRIYIKKLNLLYNKREMLNEKIILITSVGIPRKITYSQINNLKYNSKGGDKLFIKSLNEVPSVLVKKLEEMFTDVGYKITEKNDGNYFINISFNEKEEYMNVKGFKKFAFEISVEAKNNIGKRVGGYIVNMVSLGRTKKDAFQKIRNNVIKKIETNLEKLNLN